MPDNTPRDLGERTFKFACDVVNYCRQLSKEPGVVRNIAWQLADAATSAAANYQEAKAAYSRKEFALKNSVSSKELRESDLWLRVISYLRVRSAGNSCSASIRIESVGGHLYCFDAKASSGRRCVQA